MESAAAKRSNIISFEEKNFRAVLCDTCGAKMFPESLLQRHLESLLQRHLETHRLHQRWISGELRKLQNTFSRMREIA
jgi:hypothetical protein